MPVPASKKPPTGAPPGLASQGKTTPEDPSGRYGIRLALVDPRSALSDALQHTPGWKVGYEDTQSVVFVASG